MTSRPSIRSRAPKAGSAIAHRVMVANYGDNLKPEYLLRSALARKRFHFRTNCRPVPEVRCKADLVFTRARVCVFVDGCFWHGCQRHFRCPRSNSDWWLEKILATRTRDRRQTAQLRSRGWKVLRFWEHEVKNKTVYVVSAIADAIR